MLEIVRAEKVDEKNGVIYLVFIFPYWVMVFKLSEFSKKSKSIKLIYIYASERSGYALSENGIAYYCMTYCFRDIRVWSQKILLNFCWVSIFFDILTANISKEWWLRPLQTISFSKWV